MKELLRELCQVPGISGFEEEIRACIAEKIRPHVQDMKVDAVGNLIAWKAGRRKAKNELLITAHMDEVGFIVKRVDDKGYIRFAPIGGIDRRTVIGKKVLVGKARIPGAIGLRAYHLVSAKEEKIVPDMADLYIDIGATGKEDAQKLVQIGDEIVFDSDWVEFGNHRIKAKALDDRIGCAAMIRLIQSELPVDCTFVFSAQEEVGARGAFGAAFAIRPHIALVLEGTTAADLPELKEHRQVTRVGAGPVLGLMDRQTLYDRELFERLRALAEKHGIPWQTKRTISGGTDASAIQTTAGGVRVASISVPVRYIHTPSSTASLNDCEQLYVLAERFIETIANEKEDL
ncbi:MAG: M42 family metallopeptidase [Eubacteriales bacterium]|nr:M42 family metallopeptidase [Eubacteriales bacterium]